MHIILVGLLLLIIGSLIAKLRNEKFVNDPGRNDVSETQFMNRVYLAERRKLQKIADEDRKISDQIYKEYTEYLNKNAKYYVNTDKYNYQVMGGMLADIQDTSLPYSFMHASVNGNEKYFDGQWTEYKGASESDKTLISKDYNSFRGFPYGASIKSIPMS